MNIPKLTLNFIIAIFFIVIITFIIEGPMIAIVMKSFVNYVHTTTLSPAMQNTIIGNFNFIKNVWRIFIVTLIGVAFIWFIFNIYKSEADQNFI